MRLGGVIYIAPFFFVLNPALIGQAPAWEVVVALSCAMIGVTLISAALQGYISLVGPIEGRGALPMRVALFFGGVLIAMPQNDLAGLGYSLSFLIGVALCALPMLRAWQATSAARVTP
jgi:TRAP-type uncharacterized transport system fused permease subunit